MAALYLHNAIFSPEASQPPTPDTDIYNADIYSPHHRRNLSSQSTANVSPFRLSQSEFSHPTEPLLHPDTSGFLAYAELLSRQPTHPMGPQPGWDLGLSLMGDPPTMRERKDTWEQAVKRRLKRLSLTKGALELLMCAWATYNTVRYFVAFGFYSASGAQTASLVLGTSTTLSVSLFVASALISSFSPHLLSEHISTRLLRITRVSLRCLATLFLLAPAIVAFVLVFVWRNASTSDLQFRGRCHWDIDVVWSGPGSRCEPHAPPWGAWLAASIVRLVFTLITVVIYHITSRAYSHTRRPSQTYNSRFRRRNIHLPAHSVGSPSALISPTFQTMMNSSGTLATSPMSLKLTEQASSSTLTDHTRTRTTSSTSGGLNSSTSSRSRGSLRHPSSTGRMSRASSDPELDSSGEALKHAGSWHPSGSADHRLAEAGGHPSAADPFAFVDRYRTLINQVSQEIDHSLEIVQRDGTLEDHRLSSHTLTEQELERLLRSDEFGRVRVPEDHVMVLGGYIRRMPTIESLGSREMGSIASSAHRNETFISNHSGSGHNHSRPSTRANTVASEVGVEPPSRGGSSGVSSVATGGHGGGNNSLWHPSELNEGKVFLYSPDTLVESPMEAGPSTLGHGIIK